MEFPTGLCEAVCRGWLVLASLQEDSSSCHRAEGRCRGIQDSTSVSSLCWALEQGGRAGGHGLGDTGWGTWGEGRAGDMAWGPGSG